MTRRGRSRPPGRRSWAGWLPVVVAVLAAVAGFLYLEGRSDIAQQASWSRLGTSDVHALAFVDNDAQRLVFGHHGGLKTSNDGGRTWQDLASETDAMALAVVGPDSIVIAGHGVLAASVDGGRTIVPVRNDLPSDDIHGFARDPARPARMWAAIATGGVFETADGGSTWVGVRDDAVFNLAAIRRDGGTELLGVDTSGLITSPDGGRSWSRLATPPTYPMTALAGSADGQLLYAGSPSSLFRSTDGGRSWSETTYRGSVLALAAVGDSVALVSQATEFFRSEDRGQTFAEPH